MNHLRYISAYIFTALLVTLPEFSAAQRDLGGMAEIAGPGGSVTDEGVRNTVVNLLIRAVTFVGLIALVVVIIAGIIFVISGASEQQRERGKNMILYAIIGIVIISLASVFVRFFTEEIFVNP